MHWFLPLMGLVLLGVPVAFALGFVAFLGLVDTLNYTAAISQLKTILFGATNSYALSCVPMFILMGELSFQAGISTDLFKAANKWVGRLPGGLAIATNFACAVFGACSGSTIASASVFTKIALPEMLAKGYDKRLSTGAIASAGALACMIPPSILMVIYGLITSQPINKLLVAGSVPGAMTALAYGLGIYLVAKTFPHLVAPVDADKVPLIEKLKSLTGVLPIGFLFVLVMGGLFLGWFTSTSTAAGAIGSAGALLIIITFGNLFSFVLSSSGAIDSFVEFILGLNISPTLVLLLIIGLYLMVGCMVPGFHADHHPAGGDAGGRGHGLRRPHLVRHHRHHHVGGGGDNSAGGHERLHGQGGGWRQRHYRRDIFWYIILPGAAGRGFGHHHQLPHNRHLFAQFDGIDRPCRPASS